MEGIYFIYVKKKKRINAKLIFQSSIVVTFQKNV